MAKRIKAASIEERRNARRKRQKRKRTGRRITVTLLLFIGVCIGLCFTPLFSVKEIQVSGNHEVAREQVLASAGVAVGQNIFSFNIHDVDKALKQIPYVEDVTVVRHYPNVLSIELQEATPVAYLAVGGGFVMIEKNGRVLESAEEPSKYRIPLIVQEEIQNYVLGEKIMVAKESTFPVLLEVAASVSNHQFSERIREILQQDGFLYLKVSDQLQVKLGNHEKLNAKMNMLKAVLSELPEGSRGTLDMTTGDKVYLVQE